MANTVEDYFTDIKDYCQSIDLTELDLDTYCKLLQALETARDHCKGVWEEEEAVKRAMAHREANRASWMANDRILGRGIMRKHFPDPYADRN